MKNIFLIIIFIFFNQNMFGQKNRTMDSLNLILKNSNSDVDKIKTLIQLGNACEVNDNLKYAIPLINLTDKALVNEKDSGAIRNLLEARFQGVDFVGFYYRKTEGRESTKIFDTYNRHIQVCKKYDDYIGITDAVMAKAGTYHNMGEILKKLECLKEGYALMKEAKFKKGESKFVMQLAFFYAENGDTLQALNYVKKGELLELEIADSSRISRGYFLRAKFYSDIKRYDLALRNFSLAEARFKTDRDTNQLLQIYYEMGNLFKERNDFNNALRYYKTCNNLAKANNNNLSFIGGAAVGIGDVYSLQKQYEKAVKEHKFLYDIYDAMHFETVITFVGTHLANDYYMMKDYQNAKLYAYKVLAFANKSQDVPTLLEIESLVYKIDSASGNFESAFAHFQKYLFYKSKTNNELVRKASAQEKFQNDLSQQKQEAEREQERKDLLSKEEKQKQKIIIYAVGGILFLVLIFSAMLFKRFKLTNKQKAIIEEKNKEVEEKNKDIMDSIRYAKRIQTSLLPTDKYLNRVLGANDKSKHV